jgi:hypothetical protein
VNTPLEEGSPGYASGKACSAVLKYERKMSTFNDFQKSSNTCGFGICDCIFAPICGRQGPGHTANVWLELL